MAHVYTTQQFDQLDAICHRWYGRTQGTVEAVLDANPNLADMLPILPPGLLISLPDVPTPGRSVSLLRIWGVRA